MTLGGTVHVPCRPLMRTDDHVAWDRLDKPYKIALNMIYDLMIKKGTRSLHLNSNIVVNSKNKTYYI